MSDKKYAVFRGKSMYNDSTAILFDAVLHLTK